MGEFRVSPNKDKDRETVGKLATDLAAKPDEKINPIELGEEMLEGKDGFEANFMQALERGKRLHPEDFYIVVLLKKERILHNVVRQYFFTRLSCPTPEFDQCVYRFKRNDEEIQFLWTVPDWITVEKLVAHYHAVCDEQRELADFCCMFKRGDLDRMARVLNKELT